MSHGLPSVVSRGLFLWAVAYDLGNLFFSDRLAFRVLPARCACRLGLLGVCRSGGLLLMKTDYRKLWNDLRKFCVCGECDSMLYDVSRTFRHVKEKMDEMEGNCDD